MTEDPQSTSAASDEHPESAPPGGEPHDGVQLPPRGLWPTLIRLGPGMIIAGSIVGSGELIATTKVGAEAGFWLLWLIIIGCVIKVFTQVEVGRYTIAHSQTALDALNHVPGPRLRANWIVWFWAIVTLTVITQQGGIVGGIGQALTISYPLTETGHQYNELQDEWVSKQVELGQLYKQQPSLQASGITITDTLNTRLNLAKLKTTDAIDAGKVTAAQAAIDALFERRAALLPPDANEKFNVLESQIVDTKLEIAALEKEKGEPYDAYIWATILGVITSALLYVGRYGFIQAAATVLVGMFTLMTIATLVLLQLNPDWAVTGSEFGRAMSFRLPPAIEGASAKPMFAALAAFGIIGVGAIELIMYPYWCLEKGYAAHTGPRDDTPEWNERARGWMRVMRLDAWFSMVVYTFATVAFYLLGAATLGRTGLNPGGGDLIRTLAEMYVPVFGDWAAGVFLFGAFAVLYSTYFVAAAGNARMVADSLGLFGLTEKSEVARVRWTRILSFAWPLLAVAVFWIVGWYMRG